MKRMMTVCMHGQASRPIPMWEQMGTTIDIASADSIGNCFLFFLFYVVRFTSYFVLIIAVLPHSLGVVYHHETRDQNSRGCPLLF